MRRLAPLLLAAIGLAKESPAVLEVESPDRRYRFRFSEGRYEFHGEGRLLAKDEFHDRPISAEIWTRGPGVVLVLEIADGETLALLGADGRFRWKLALKAAIPGGFGGTHNAEGRRIVRSPRAWWVDEPRGKAVVVAPNKAIAEVDLETGGGNVVGTDVILLGLALPGAREEALDVGVELEMEGFREAAEKLAADVSLDPVSRLLAAVAVERSGGARVTREIWDAMLAAGESPAATRALVFAGRHVADLDLLVQTALRKDNFAYGAITALSERDAADELAGLLTHASIGEGPRKHAALLLGEQAPEKAIEVIDKEMEDADARQAGQLLNAAIAARVPDLERHLQHHEAKLLKILDKETGDLSWLAGYFKGRPTSEAVQPLLRSLARHKRDPGLRKRLIGALKPCTGEDYGDNADAWIEALAKKK